MGHSGIQSTAPNAAGVAGCARVWWGADTRAVRGMKVSYLRNGGQTVVTAEHDAWGPGTRTSWKGGPDGAGGRARVATEDSVELLKIAPKGLMCLDLLYKKIVLK